MGESVQELLLASRQARLASARLDTAGRSALMAAIAQALRSAEPEILAANAYDLAQLPASYAMADRLRLNHDRLEALAQSVLTLPQAPCRLGETLEERDRPSGIHLRRIAVPLGVVACIYEARPNVTVDVAAMCLMSGNVAVLKGGKEAAATNLALVKQLHLALAQMNLPEACVTLLPSTHEAAETLMTANGLIDVLIPRGSARLIQAVRSQATVPTIETGAGVCHLYIHEDADLEIAKRVLLNAKTRRVSVCNALDSLLVHASLRDALPELLASCVERGVTIHEEAGSHEWLSMDLSVKIVPSLDAALAHIAQYGSGHSEAIVTQSPDVAARFQSDVDAACVYVNTPTSFTDGGEFGLGAEIGISTQKLHARGPMGLNALLTSKWLISSNGAVRP